MSDNVLVAILAAGRSRRFGSDKLATDIGGMTLGERAVKLAHATGHPIIWIGSGKSWEPPNCAVVQNPIADQGMGTSVALAAKIAIERKADAILILLADMPMVSAALLQEMLSQRAPACCRYPDGNAGPPALLRATHFAALAELNGDAGARQILRALPDMIFVAPPAHELVDIDQPADLAALNPR
jgi:molybdenum cofactor cytidylyltransferase